MIPAFIALGSNLDHPRGHIERALEELARLPASRLTVQSRLYLSAPVGPPQPDYINAVARLDTELEPLALLDQLQALERAHQRERGEHWGPRTLDLDLLLYGEQHIDHPRLQVPHPHMAERAFVLVPLAEIAPALRLPSGTPLASLLEHCSREGLSALSDQPVAESSVTQPSKHRET